MFTNYISHERLTSVLHYSPETGIFVRPKFKGQHKVGCLSFGYLKIRIDGHHYPAHWLAWFYVHKVWPKQLDHINRVKTDNRICNLREVTQGQNNQNIINRKPTTSGYVGVHKHDGKYWRVQITINRKSKHIGLFRDPAEAHKAYLEAKKKYHPFFTADS